MGGASPLNISSVLGSAERDGKGFRQCIPLLLDAAGVSTGPLTASTTPEKIAFDTDMDAIKWDHGDGTTHIVKWSFVMPFTYDPLAKNSLALTDDLILYVDALKLDSGADENDNLELHAQLTWGTPGDAAKSQLTTAAETGALAASVTAAGFAGLARYTVNIGTRLQAEGKRIEAGDQVTIGIYPNETVGSADMDLIMLPPMLVYRGNPNFTDSTLRG